MCILCSSKISLEERIKQLKDDTDFNEFNTTSVQIILYSCIGMHGEEAKEIAIRLMKRFISWYQQNKPICYMPKNGLEPMYHPLVLARLVKFCDTFQVTETEPLLMIILFQKMVLYDNEIMAEDKMYYLHKTIEKNKSLFTFGFAGLGLLIGGAISYYIINSLIYKDLLLINY